MFFFFPFRWEKNEYEKYLLCSDVKINMTIKSKITNAHVEEKRIEHKCEEDNNTSKVENKSHKNLMHIWIHVWCVSKHWTYTHTYMQKIEDTHESLDAMHKHKY